MKTLPLVHLVRQPIIKAGTPPLLLLLHGIGSNEHDLYELAPLIASNEELRGLPFLVVHGTADMVLPITYGHDTRELLSSLQVDLTYHEYPMGHEVSQESLREVTTWLSEQLNKTR